MIEKATQCKRILQYIEEFGSITNREASFHLGILNFGARMTDLRKQGVHFEVKQEQGKNRYGDICTYNRYTLRSDAQ
jgi:biotin synthase-like enzyme